MIPIVEMVLSEVIEAKLKVLKTNADIVDRIFSQSPVTLRNRLKTYLTSGGLSVMRGYPNDRAKMPCYAIMLGGETESEKELGSYLGEEDSYEIENSTLTLKTVKKSGSVVLEVPRKPIEFISTVTATIDGSPVDFEVLDAKRGLIGFPEYESIDVGEELEITYSHPVTTGNDFYGSIFTTQYRIETWTTNGDLTVMLYHLLKWIMLISRDTLEEKGVQLQTLGGLDFEPAPEYMPELVYRRALTFESIITNSYEKEFYFIQDIILDGEPSEEG